MKGFEMSLFSILQNQLTDLVQSVGLSLFMAQLVTAAVLLLLLFSAVVLVDLVIKNILLNVLGKIVKKSKTSWDDVLLNKKVFNRVAHIVPAVLFYYGSEACLSDFPDFVPIVQAITKLYLLMHVTLAVDSLLNAVHEIYNSFEFAANRPIKSYVQVAKIVLYFIAVILFLSILLDKSVVYFFSGLGALAAVLMLVFKDSILGLVAGVQLTGNNMVKPGDWICVPRHNADGTVLEITLHTVKVQNWDKTITTVPTYALIAESFQNWKGMEESGGRRIKRSLFVDMKTIKFCTPSLIEKCRKMDHLREYIAATIEEIDNYNQHVDRTVTVNGRALTNVGVFRKYLEHFLRAHPKIHQEMTFLIRQLQPTDKGLPIELYLFTNITAWVEYERIQADIFDHIFAVLPEFELSVFQSPSGNDLSKLLPSAADVL